MGRKLLFFSLVLSTSALAQIENGEHRIDVNGTRLFVDIRGSGEPLVVIHGGPGLNHQYFLPHLNPLDKDFSVIYYDQRACGQSAIPAPDSITMEYYIQDIEALRKKLQLDKINILAHSWGAVLAARYGIKYPGRVRKMILSNPAMLSQEYDEEAAALVKQHTTRQDSVERATILSAESLSVADYEKIFLLTFRLSAFDRSALSNLHLGLSDNFIKANKALYSGLSKDPSLSYNLYDSLASFPFPVLVIHGESDVIPKTSIDRLAQQIPNVSTAIFHRSGHFPFIEEPVLYNETVKKFLEVK